MEERTIERRDRITRAADVVGRPLQGGGGVLLHVPSGQYHGTNETGWLIWELVDGARNVSDIEREVAARTGEDVAAVSDDVLEFLGGLVERHLVSLEG